MRISDWSSDVCSSDLSDFETLKNQGRRVPAFAGMTNKSDLASAAKDRFACASTSLRRTPMSSTHDSASLDQHCIDTLRFLSVDMVQKDDSGLPALPFCAAPDRQRTRLNSSH